MGTVSSTARSTDKAARSTQSSADVLVESDEREDDNDNVSFHNAVEHLSDEEEDDNHDETMNEAAAEAARGDLPQDFRDNNDSNLMNGVQQNNPRNDANDLDIDNDGGEDLPEENRVEVVPRHRDLAMFEGEFMQAEDFFEYYANNNNNAPRLLGRPAAAANANHRHRQRQRDMAVQRRQPQAPQLQRLAEHRMLEQNLRVVADAHHLMQEQQRMMMMMMRLEDDLNHVMNERRRYVDVMVRRAPQPPPPPPPPPENPRVTHKRHLEQGMETWMDVPADLQRDESFAWSIQEFRNQQLLRSILQAHPTLARNKKYWKHIFPLTVNIQAQVASLFREFADESFFQDDAFMLLACTYSPRIQLLLQGETREKDRYFWQSLIDKDPMVLRTLPHWVQRQFPAMIDETLPVVGRMPWPEQDRYAILQVAPNMVPEFWRERENVRKWFTAGMPMYPHQFNTIELLANLKHDKQVFRWIAQHCRSSLKLESFSSASLELRSDKAFMLECVALDPRMLRCAVHDLRQDFDLVLTACAGPRALVALYLEETRFLMGQAKFIPRFHNRIRNIHISNQSFHPVGLQGMTSCSGSSLALLNENVKKIIAVEFLEVSIQQSQIKLVEVALLNLDAIRGVPSAT